MDKTDQTGKSTSTNDAMTGILKGLDKAEWFHGLLPREDIVLLLKEEGQFLVRQTDKDKEQKSKHRKTVLSVYWKKKHRHYILNRTKDGKVCIDSETFDTVVDLIRHYHTKKIPVGTKDGTMLLTPVPKQEWELNHDQIQLGKLLGEGAFGGVYEGEMQLAAGRKIAVAVKVHKGKEMGKEVIKEIGKEARIMRRYEHKNIVKFYGIAMEREPIMLVMEMVSGGALDKYLLKNGDEISAFKKLNMCCDASTGLEYLHEKQCIHRDVAARNCLVSNNIVKISDFGLSREMTDRQTSYTLTDSQQRLPIRWLAPETLKECVYSKKSDVFAFGILMWEVFANGATPYTGMTMREAGNYVKAGNRLSPPDMMPMMVRTLMTNKCFPEDPSKRATMSEICQELEKLCRRGPRTINNTEKSTQSTKSVWENRPGPDINVD